MRASRGGRVPLDSDLATEERYMGTLMCLCVVARWRCRGPMQERERNLKSDKKKLG